MGTILEEFREFLQSILDFHAQSISNFPGKNIAKKSNELQTFTEDYNIKAIDRAVEILENRNLDVDKGKLSTELAHIINEYSKKFLNAHFMTGNKPTP